MMKKDYFCLMVFMCFMIPSIFAQVGINNTDPKAQLDITANDPSNPTGLDGLLIPRVNAFPSNPTQDQHSMLIYLNAQSGSSAPGFYYWDNNDNQWKSFGSGEAPEGFWEIDGNSGTDSATDFIGTTDNVDFIIRTNNQNKVRISTKGQIETLNTGASIFLGENAGESNTVGEDNVFIGNDAGTSNISGEYNVFVGNDAGEDNEDGSSNIAVGRRALYRNVSGNSNTAIGLEALNDNETGGNNVALGLESLNSNVSGNNNIAIGVGSLDHMEEGSGNIAIGFEAGYYEEDDNRLYIENSRDNMPLIGGDFDLDKVGIDVNLDQLTHTLTVGGDIHASSDIETASDLTVGGGIHASSNIETTADLTVGGGIHASSNIETTADLTVGGDIHASSNIETAANLTVGGNISSNGSILSVGDIKTQGEFISGTTTYPDYVFEDYYSGVSEILPSYDFISLDEAEKFVKENGHLPGVKSYKEMEADNFKYSVGETAITNLEKIEELFLYITELNKKIKSQEEQLEKKDQKIQSLENRLEKLEQLILSSK